MISGRVTSIYSWPRLEFGQRPQSRPGRRLGRRSRRSGNGRRRPAGRAYQVQGSDSFDLEQFAAPENLVVAWEELQDEGGHGAGIDGVTFEDLSWSEVFDALRRVSPALTGDSYRPQKTRNVRIAKANGGHRELRLQVLIDRTIAKALQLAVKRPIYGQVTGTPRDVWGTYAAIQEDIRRNERFIMATEDIRNCFPSAPLQTVMDTFGSYIDQPDLLWLIDRVIRGHKSPDETTGLDQGSPFSPLAMELLLHTRLDTRFKAECPGFPLYRYVDNLTLLCHSTREAQDLIQTTGQILERTGFSLKGKDDPPADLREHPRTVLGLNVGWDSGQLTFTIPETAYEDLQEGLHKAMIQPAPTDAMRSVARGWINAVGPALTNAVSPTVVDRVMETARDCGMRSLNRRDLVEHAQTARSHWLETSSQNTAANGKEAA